MINVNRTVRLNNLQFYPVVRNKVAIFLHHTAGSSAISAIKWWDSTPEKVGAPYVIERDGTIYECFNPDLFSFHLGVKGDDNFMESHSVAIEIVSRGKVYPDDLGNYWFYPAWPLTTQRTKVPKENVVKYNWRGHDYWEAYTEAQIKAVCELVVHLVEKYSITITKANFKNFFLYNEKVLVNHIPGIWGHTTVRKDKVDIVPFPEFIKALEKTLFP